MNQFPENLTVLVLLGLGITAACALGAEAKDVLIAISSGLVGYLTRGTGGKDLERRRDGEGKANGQVA